MTRSRREVLLGLAVVGLLPGGCSLPLRSFPFDGGPPGEQGAGLEVRFYSVTCFRVRYGDVALLTDPFWSHLSFEQVAHHETLPDPMQVDPYLDQLGDVQAVVVGHAHYDHMLDLPYVADSLGADATIFGSATLGHQLAPNHLPRPVIPVNGVAATPDTSGAWQTAADGALRILPIRSGHPDQLPGIHLFRKRLTEDRSTPPNRAGHYQEGETFAYLVDFLDDGAIKWRVYVQTSSRGAPDGFFPAAIRDEHPVDVALLAMDCARQEANSRAPSIIDFLDPATVIFGHWEDFFRRKDAVPYEAAKVNLRSLRRRLPTTQDRTYLFPGWDSDHFFPNP